jgi:hypothetical protein
MLPAQRTGFRYGVTLGVGDPWDARRVTQYQRERARRTAAGCGFPAGLVVWSTRRS